MDPPGWVGAYRGMMRLLMGDSGAVSLKNTHTRGPNPKVGSTFAFDDIYIYKQFKLVKRDYVGGYRDYYRGY